MGTNKPWTDELVSQLRSLVSPERSCNDIAKIMGISRNAVIGKLKRIGVANPYLVASTSLAVSISNRRRVSNLPVKSPSPKPLPPAAPTPFVPAMLNIWELTNFTCHWPIGDPFDEGFRYCGSAKSPDGPYCEHHFKVSRRPKNEQSSKQHNGNHAAR